MSLAALAVAVLAGLYIFQSLASRREDGLPDPAAVAAGERMILGERRVDWEKVTVGEGAEAAEVEVADAGEQTGLPAECNPREVAHLITRFFGAISRGDEKLLTGFFDQTIFEQYTVGEKGDGGFHAIYSVEELIPYFALKQRQQEEVRLLKLAALKGIGADRVEVGYISARRANDLAGVVVTVGTGTVDCRTQKIIIWSELDITSPGEPGTEGP